MPKRPSVGAGDELLIEVGPALGDQYRSYSIDTAAEIADLSLSSWIGVYDASNQTAGRSAFAQLESQYHQQPWIVLCADDDRPNWRDVLSRGGACAVISRAELSVPTFTAALEKATQRLWQEAGLRVVPGRYLAREQQDGSNPGADYIRVAMVQNKDITAEAMHRLVAVLG